MANNNNKTKYLVLCEWLSYPPDRVVMAGEVVDDIPLSSVRHELEAGHIVEVQLDQNGNPIMPAEMVMVMRFYDKDGNEIPNDGTPPEDSGILPISELPAEHQDLLTDPTPAAEPEPEPVQEEEATEAV